MWENQLLRPLLSKRKDVFYSPINAICEKAEKAQQEVIEETKKIGRKEGGIKQYFLITLVNSASQKTSRALINNHIVISITDLIQMSVISSKFANLRQNFILNVFLALLRLE